LSKWIKALCVAAFAAACGTSWAQSCNDLTAPAQSPATGVEIYFDIQAVNPKDTVWNEEVALRLAGAANSPPVKQLAYRSSKHSKPDIGEQHPFQTPFIWPNLVDPRKQDTRTLRELDGWVYIYEPDGKGGRRVCRIEHWQHRFQELDHNERQVQRDKPLAVTGPASGEANPVLAKLAENYRRDEIKHFIYNSQGLVERYLESDPVYVNQDATQVWTSKTVACYYYDKDSRPRRYVEPNNDSTGSVCDPIKEGQGKFTDYYYDTASGAFRGARFVNSLNEDHRKEAYRPIWDIRWAYVPDGRQEQIAALADAKQQLYYFTSDREIEGVPLPRPRSAKDISYAYYFYEALPLSFMDGPGDPEKKVKQYHRERRRDFAGEVYISEYFAANGGLQHRIWWRGMDWAVFRHEQYDAQGRLKRAINRGLANEEHTYYAESDGYKSQLTQRPYLLHRVYEYDKAGKESLVAISWFNHDPRIDHPYRTPGRGGALIDLAKDAKRAWADRNKPKPAVKEELKQLHGTPDGKVKWKDAESFGKAFGIFWEFKDMDRFVEAKRRAEGLPKGSRIE